MQEDLPELDGDDAINRIIRADALFAISIATALVRSNLYFSGI